MNLIEVKNGEPITNSYIVSKEFNIDHFEILRKVRNLSMEISDVRFSEMFKIEKRMVRGRGFDQYIINRDGYMFIVMNISTKKANSKKLAFIDAFNAMEKSLLTLDLNKGENQWLRLRVQSKAERLRHTDVIKEFVEYATKQGSKSAKYYYKHYTNATYKVLGLIQHKKPKLKDTLDFMELSQLMVAENLAKQSIRKHMKNGENYKNVFVLVKQDLVNFGNSIMITKKQDKE